jgi:hypothetical protein
MDDGCEALIGFVRPHCDAFEFLELAEEILDRVPPLVEFFAPRSSSPAMMALLMQTSEAVRRPAKSETGKTVPPRSMVKGLFALNHRSCGVSLAKAARAAV